MTVILVLAALVSIGLALFTGSWVYILVTSHRNQTERVGNLDLLVRQMVMGCWVFVALFVTFIVFAVGVGQIKPVEDITEPTIESPISETTEEPL